MSIGKEDDLCIDVPTQCNYGIRGNGDVDVYRGIKWNSMYTIFKQDLHLFDK